MGHIRRYIHRFLQIPAGYEFLQTLVGVRRSRRVFIQDYVRPWSGARILDIGCGTGAILDYLPDEVDYTGFDFSADYIRFAQKRYGQRGRFRCRQLDRDSAAAAGPWFDIVLANGVLHHLDDGETGLLFGTAHACLKPGGRLVTIDPVFGPGLPAIARLLITRDRGVHVRTRAAYVELARKSFREVHDSVRTDTLYLPYAHLILVCPKDAEG